MNYIELEESMQKQQTAIFDKYGVGFAYSDEQMDQYIQGEREKGYNGEFTRISNIPGMYCRSETVDAMAEDLKALHKSFYNDVRQNVPMDDYIEYELNNHEAYYTGNYLDPLTVSVIQSKFPEATKEEIRRVFFATRGEYQE